MTFIDLTNQTFGDLKVIKRDYEYGKNKGLKEWNKKTFWECQCLICNEKVIKQGSVLRKKGQTTKCPKCGRTNVKIGQKYGLLTILSKDYNYSKENNIKGKAAYFKCQCDCGNIITTRADTILQKEKPNCGCLAKQKFKEIGYQKADNLTGQKFGLLTVICLDKMNSKPGQVFWKTKCDCGNFYSVCGKHLKRGATLSCGCLRQSYGELRIAEILRENNIPFIKEYVVKELNNKRFDFAIIENDKIVRLIEYDGEQHFKPSHFFGEEEFKKRQESDCQKNEWAISKNIPLVRIPYQYKNKITYSMIMENESFLIK